MAKMGGFSVTEMKRLQQLNKIQQRDVEVFIEMCAKELATRLLALKVIKRTPVGRLFQEN